MTGPAVEDVPGPAEEADRGTKRVRTEDTAGPVEVPPSTTVDAELDSFLSSLSTIPVDAPAEITAAPTTVNKSKYKPSQPETQTFYSSAASIAPPPPKGTTISSGATAASNPFAGRLVKNVDIGPALPADDVEEEEQETEAERRAREQREEREEIMGRLEDEQRAQ